MPLLDQYLPTPAKLLARQRHQASRDAPRSPGSMPAPGQLRKRKRGADVPPASGPPLHRRRLQDVSRPGYLPSPSRVTLTHKPPRRLPMPMSHTLKTADKTARAMGLV